MSDEEDVFGENDDNDQMAADYTGFPEEEESLEALFNEAEAVMVMDKKPDEASDLFYDIYMDARADNELKGKCLSAAADCISQVGEDERIAGVLTDVFDALQNEIIDNSTCGQIIRIMRENIMHNEESYTTFLDKVMELIDANSQLELYIDLKLRQVQLALKKANYQQAQDYLNDAQAYISIPPDPKDEKMCDFAFRILLFYISICEISTKDENQIFQYYKQIKTIDQKFIDDEQKAVLYKIEGQIALHDGEYLQAADKFYESFRLFDQSGDIRKLRCLPFLALSIMLLPNKNVRVHDLDPIILFADGKIVPYYNHPIVAPMKQLLDAYNKTDYLDFLTKTPFVHTYFAGVLAEPQYIYDLIEICRKNILRKYISIFCQNYRSLDFDYLIKSIQCEAKEVRDLIFEMVTTGELEAVLDSDIIYIKHHLPLSDELQNVEIIFDAIHATDHSLFIQPSFPRDSK